MGEFPAQLLQAGSAGGIACTSQESVSDIFDFLAVGTGFAGAAWPAANRAIFIPFALSQPVTIKQVAWQNGTTVSGNVDVGIYGITGTRIAHTGSVAQATISAVQIADIADTTLDPGVYFMAMAVDNTTGLFFRCSNAAVLLMEAFGIQTMDTAFVLPDPATFANPAAAYIPQLVLLMNATA